MAVKFTESFRKGNIFTKLSILIPGLGNLVGKQIIKGIMYIAIEAAFVCFMIMRGINCLAMLPGLGSRPQQECDFGQGLYQARYCIGRYA